MHVGSGTRLCPCVVSVGDNAGFRSEDMGKIEGKRRWTGLLLCSCMDGRCSVARAVEVGRHLIVMADRFLRAMVCDDKAERHGSPYRPGTQYERHDGFDEMGKDLEESFVSSSNLQW